MKFFLYFLTIAFGIVCFVIMKKKRYKVMPLICLIMFICFIGFGIISLVYSFVPYGEIFVMGLASILDFITIKSVLGRKSMRLY